MPAHAGSKSPRIYDLLPERHFAESTNVAKELHLGRPVPIILATSLPSGSARTARSVERYSMTHVRTTVFSDPRVPAVEGASARARADRTGCPWHDVKSMLRQVGLRPTRQRMALGWILFAKGDRHLTAEMLYEEASKAKVPISLATVYNALHQFTEVGLLRQVAVDGSKTYFDTNVSDHHHFFVEGENALVDIPNAEVMLDRLPTAPPGYEVARIDVVVRLRKTG